MSIYDQSMQKLPTETLTEYFARLKALRGGSILGTSGMMDIPTPGEQRQARQQAQQAGIAQPGQAIVRPVTDAQMAAQAERESGMSESERDALVERDTPEKQQARRDAALNKQLNIALGGEPGMSNLDAAGGLLGIGGTPLFGAAALGLGGFADWYDRDVAALELGKRIGKSQGKDYDVADAKKIGYEMLALDKPALSTELANLGITPDITPKSEGSFFPKVVSTVMGPFASMFQKDESDASTPTYTDVSSMQQGMFKKAVAALPTYSAPDLPTSDDVPTLAQAVSALPSYSAPALPADVYTSDSDSNASNGGSYDSGLGSWGGSASEQFI